jgi:hypothetical protein
MRKSYVIKENELATANEMAITIQDIGNKCLVTGDTYQHKTILKEMGGKWNKDQKGWMFSETDEVKIWVEEMTTTATKTGEKLDVNVVMTQLIMMVGELKNEVKNLRKEIRQGKCTD